MFLLVYSYKLEFMLYIVYTKQYIDNHIKRSKKTEIKRKNMAVSYWKKKIWSIYLTFADTICGPSVIIKIRPRRSGGRLQLHDGCAPVPGFLCVGYRYFGWALTWSSSFLACNPSTINLVSTRFWSSLNYALTTAFCVNILTFSQIVVYSTSY